ncbi:hypothetical protein Dsin_001731 [Dipteronia sinensis]|uniref:Uncharacterized protein n=1 Tax=Dipteronia sinensis TaxID=43782 RepID=A0AAE0B5W2_9ROSI|nr:hypothetical protein Dsin_001731 [Dipteronia sinensis]
MVTRGRIRDHAETTNKWEKQKDGIGTIHIQDTSGHEDVTCLGNVYTIGKYVAP